MSLPQLNHTQVSNAFIDQWMAELTGGSVKVFLAIARKTIGWQKESDAVSYEQLAAMTGMSRQSVSNALKELGLKGLIRTRKRPNCTTVYTIAYEMVVQKVDCGSLKSRPQSSLKSRLTKETIKETSTKESIKGVSRPEPYRDDFEQWWKVYPRKKEKVRAYKAYVTDRRKGENAEALMTAVKKYAQECRAEAREEKYIKHAATFLGPTEPWKDYVQPEGELADDGTPTTVDEIQRLRVQQKITHEEYVRMIREVRGA